MEAGFLGLFCRLPGMTVVRRNNIIAMHNRTLIRSLVAFGVIRVLAGRC